MISASVSVRIGQRGAAEAAGAPSEDIGRICHAHPSMSEVMREAALAVDKRSLNG